MKKIHTNFSGQYTKQNKRNCTGNSLAVQWLGLGAFTVVAHVQSLVG